MDSEFRLTAAWILLESVYSSKSLIIHYTFFNVFIPPGPYFQSSRLRQKQCQSGTLRKRLFYETSRCCDPEQHGRELSKTFGETMHSGARYLVFFQYIGTRYRWVIVSQRGWLLLLVFHHVTPFLQWCSESASTSAGSERSPGPLGGRFYRKLGQAHQLNYLASEAGWEAVSLPCAHFLNTICMINTPSRLTPSFLLYRWSTITV